MGETGQEASWTDVVRRKSKKNAVNATPAPGTATSPPLASRPQRVRTRPPEILVDVASCNDFPALTKRIKDGMDSKTIGNGITSMKKAKNGGILMEIRGDDAAVEAIRSEVAKSAGQDVSIRLLGQKTLLEIRDIDAWTGKEDIADCITRETPMKILPNVGGARQWKRKVLAMAVQSKLLYAAPVWADALMFECNVKTIVRPQRRMALRVAEAYRTVSANAILVVAGMVPAHLKAQEQQFKFRALKEGIVVEERNLRDMTFRKWQAQWDSTKTGLWPKRLISVIRKWTDRRFGETDFHLTQMLTGHGCFGYYLHKYKKREDPACVDCGSPVDDVEHTLFKYDRWWRQRELEVKMGADMEPDTVVTAMLQNAENWKAVKNYAGMVLSTKEEEERRAQRARAAAVII